MTIQPKNPIRDEEESMKRPLEDMPYPHLPFTAAEAHVADLSRYLKGNLLKSSAYKFLAF